MGDAHNNIIEVLIEAEMTQNELINTKSHEG